MPSEFDQLPLRKRLELNAASVLGWFLILLLGKTYRFRFEGTRALTALEQGKQAFLIGIWHGRFWVFVYLFRGRKYVALVSQHVDGEMIARTILRLGFRTVRGSSTRGGKKAFHEMVAQLRDGKRGVIIPDGPKGPRHQLKPGIVYMAQQAGIPILPVTFAAKRALRFNSWDRFVVPLPFTKVLVKVGKPFWIPRDASPRQLARLKDRLEKLMIQQEREADAYFSA